MQYWDFPEDADPSPREPDALCDHCEARGTIARITFSAPVSRTFRICANCWSMLRTDENAIHALLRQGDPYDAPRESQDTHYVTESRCWDDVVDFVDLIRRIDDEEWLAEQARSIRDTAHEYDGPMPQSVACFIGEHLN